MTVLLDTHCHLDQYPNVQGVLADARRVGVAMVAVTDNPDAYRRLRTRLGTRANDVSVALGLHPASAAAASPGQLGRFFRMLPETQWVGEVGLDFGPDIAAAEKRKQRTVFEAILDHDQIRSKILSVHSRGATPETVDLLGTASCRAILHWFTGNQTTADRAAAHGLWFSINQAMTRSPRGRQLIARLPPDQVLCETDGPYCESVADLPPQRMSRRSPVHSPRSGTSTRRTLPHAWSATPTDLPIRYSALEGSFNSRRPFAPSGHDT